MTGSILMPAACQGREGQDKTSAPAVAQGMDLSRSTAAGAGNRLTLLPPFEHRPPSGAPGCECCRQEVAGASVCPRL